jgi:hypothetical protein
MGHTTGDITTYYSKPDLIRLQEFVDRLADAERATVLRIKRPESGQNAGTERGKTRDLANAAQVLDNGAPHAVGQ